MRLANPVALLAGRVGIRRAGRAVLGGGLAMLVVCGGLGVLFLSPGAWSPGLVERVGYVGGARDADLDGLADAAENLVGSDVDDPSTLAEVPDGWIHHWFSALDWSDPSILDAPALAPPSDALPEPLRTAGALPLPTLAQLYAAEEEARGGKYAWWLTGPALDPRQWDNNGDGVADAWVLAYGLDPLAVDPDSASPGDPALTLREKYAQGLDPTLRDSDGDGLLDAEEARGLARFGAMDRTFDPTDPRQFSSRADGVADGYLVRFGLDPARQGVAALQPAGDGVSVLEAFQATWSFCGRGPDPCDLRAALEGGQAVDPTRVDTLADGVTDAWALRDPLGKAHPLLDARKQTAFTSSDWDAGALKARPRDPWANGTLVDGANPLPAAPHSVTLRDLYAHKRPTSWDENKTGTWWHGLPTSWDGVPGSLPPAIALRGWTVVVDTQLGRNGTQAPAPDAAVRLPASADPRKADSDGDGLADREEYFGVSWAGAAFPRTDPGNPDTDGDGLRDGREVGPASLGTDPARRDTAGSFLTDGQKVGYWTDRAANAQSGKADLAPKGDLDRDGRTNVLDDDTDGDGLRDGAELFPDRFLDKPSSNSRPATDPAHKDTDGDTLPDWWEVDWSDDRAFGCKDCILPSGAIAAQVGWPLDPSKALSVPGARGAEGASSTCPSPAAQWCDADINLAGDFVRLPSGARRPYSSGIAYNYDLDPYQADADGDGVPNMFSIHWGAENVPGFAMRAVPPDHWSVQESGRLRALLASRGAAADRIDPIVVLNPHPQGKDPLGAASNLLQLFAGQEKGTWAFTTTCGPGAVTSLAAASVPATRSESARPRDPDNPGSLLADRTAIPPLKGACWSWVPYPLSQDVLRGTNPWRHDSDPAGDGLPDAWEAFYGVDAGISGTEATPGSLAADCGNTLLHVVDRPVDGSTGFCVTYLQAYERGLDPRSPDTDSGGLPDWVEIKLVGLDPLDRLDDRGEEDWDGDGLINLVEDKLGSSRLDPDSDGDGLLDGDMHGDRYRVERNLPDKDLTFLLGTNGAGNLCLPGGPGSAGWTAPVRNATGAESTQHRPAALGGPLTYQMLVEDYLRRGVLHVRDTDGTCPPGQVLFRREGIYDRGQDLVLAAGLSDSTAWDTSGDGLPDGWSVFWRDRTTDDNFHQALGPHQDLGPASPEELRDPDGDFLSSVEEYGAVSAVDLQSAPRRSAFDWRRPDEARARAAWDEGRDGTWWAGPDPTTQDSDGDKEWYASLEEADDRVDSDLDNDGIPDRHDPFPALDPLNLGIVSWDPANGGRFRTDYAKLWGALDARPATSFLDPDLDGVPTFLDRFRVQVHVNGVDLDAERLEKGGSGFTVTGFVDVDEPAQAGFTDTPGFPTGTLVGDGALVGGLTVKAVLRDAAGREALAGFAFTGEHGAFAIHGAVGNEAVGGAAPPGGASVAGRLVQGGEKGRVPTPEALALATGDVRLFVVTEANDGSRQPLSFQSAGGGSLAHVAAFKQASPSFTIPDGLPPAEGAQPGGPRVTSVRIDTADERPADDDRLFRHATQAAFAGVAATSSTLRLSASTSLELDEPEPVFQGTDLTLTGRLLDSARAPLPDRTVDLVLHPQGGAAVTLPPATVTTDGSFTAVVPTAGIPPGAVLVEASASLDELFLSDPQKDSVSAVVALDMRWQSLRIDGRDLLNGGLAPPAGAPPLRADRPIAFEGRLVDHLDPPRPLANRPVTVTVQTVSGQAVLPPSTLQTGADGVLRATLPPMPPGTPLSTLQVRASPHTVTGADKRQDAVAFLDLLQPARVVVVSNATTPVDVAGEVRVALERLDGARVADPALRLLVTGNGEPRVIQGTDSQGVARFAVNASQPGRLAWTVAFQRPESGPLSLLDASDPIQASSLHVGAPVLRLGPVAALRGQLAAVAGNLTLPAGAPVAGATVQLQWEGTNATLQTDEWGAFVARLPAPAKEGASALVARFAGAHFFAPAEAKRSVTVQVPTNLTAVGHNVTFGTDHKANGPLVVGLLTDERGSGLGDRRLQVRLAHKGNFSLAVKAEIATDVEGRFTLDAARAFPALPGTWSVEVSFNGTTLQVADATRVAVGVTHTVVVELLRAPAVIDAGRPYILAGRLNASSIALGPILLNATLEGQSIGSAPATSAGWSIPFTAPLGPNGTRTLRVEGTARGGIIVHAAQGSVLLTSPVTASILETPRSDGSRHLGVQVEGPDGLRLEGLGVVLVREAASGELESLVATLNATGHASIELASWQSGMVRVVALRNPALQLASATYGSRDTVQVEVRTSVSPWTYALSAGALFALGTLGAYIAWRRRQLHSLRHAVRESHDLLLDPKGSPAQAIRLLYQCLLRCLRDAGHVVGAQETVRDISTRAVREIGLPRVSMDGITYLFELACYSDRELTQAQRLDAADLTRSLAAYLGVPLRIKSGPSKAGKRMAA